MAEDDYKDKLFYQSQLENLVTSIFDKQTASSFLENNKLFLDSVSTAIASFFANTFEGYKSALKWVDLVKVIEIFVNFYRGLIAKVDDNTKAKVIDLFKQLIVRLSVDLRADFTNLKLETFAKYKDLLNELLSILIDQHAILEETISRWLFINLKPGQILGLLEKIRFALSDEKDSKDAT